MGAAQVLPNQFDALIWLVRYLECLGRDRTFATAVHALGRQHMPVVEIFHTKPISCGTNDSVVHALLYTQRSIKFGKSNFTKLVDLNVRCADAADICLRC